MTYKNSPRATNRPLPFTLRTTSRTTLGLTVAPTGEVIVRGPHDTTHQQAADLVQRRREWIYRQLNAHLRTAPDEPEKHLTDGESFNVFGRPHRLRVVPNTSQNTPVVLHYDTGTDPEIYIRRSAINNHTEAVQELTNLYAATGQRWLEKHGPTITAHTTNPAMPLRFSTRMRTGRAYTHPTRGLTLHWATAQLPTTCLRELIHRTLGLHSVINKDTYEHQLRALWLGHLTPTQDTTPTDACLACSAPRNTFHTEHCTTALCARTGRQRRDCGHDGPACNTIWTGQQPGTAECTEYGFFRRYTPGLGYEPCNADDPHAEPDLNRLARECIWDIRTQRMVLPA
ncbi:YgjP-like metallopeptidase domain-containing protein [Streptomyces syringium]|uniref:YgjP-like metallopeptidase domain-containing protein n=1 Tax=Streptomyces syringium TaxID=76729 RepID=UPI003D8D0F5C